MGVTAELDNVPANEERSTVDRQRFGVCRRHLPTAYLGPGQGFSSLSKETAVFKLGGGALPQWGLGITTGEPRATDRIITMIQLSDCYGHVNRFIVCKVKEFLVHPF